MTEFQRIADAPPASPAPHRPGSPPHREAVRVTTATGAGRTHGGTGMTGAQVAESLLTGPALAARLGVGLDRLRKAIRARPELLSLFVWVGGSRVLPAERLDDLRAGLGLQPARAG